MRGQYEPWLCVTLFNIIVRKWLHKISSLINSFSKNNVLKNYNGTTYYIILNFTATFTQYELSFTISIVSKLQFLHYSVKHYNASVNSDHEVYSEPYQTSTGSSKNDVTGIGGEDVLKVSDKKGHRVEGVHANSNIITKKTMHKFLFFTCFWSVQQL